MSSARTANPIHRGVVPRRIRARRDNIFAEHPAQGIQIETFSSPNGAAGVQHNALGFMKRRQSDCRIGRFHKSPSHQCGCRGAGFISDPLFLQRLRPGSRYRDRPERSPMEFQRLARITLRDHVGIQRNASQERTPISAAEASPPPFRKTLTPCGSAGIRTAHVFDDADKSGSSLSFAKRDGDSESRAGPPLAAW